MISVYLLIDGHLFVCLVELYFSFPLKWKLHVRRNFLMFAHYCMSSAEQSAWLIVRVNIHLSKGEGIRWSGWKKCMDRVNDCIINHEALTYST